MTDGPYDDVLTVLREGSITLAGQFNWGSNFTFLVEVEHSGKKLQAVYKPNRGVRPLWDFPSNSLARREVAAYLVSQALDWELVPPTVYRRRGPIGAGSLQLYIPHNPEYYYFTFSQPDKQRLRPAALFDLLVNNADRKGTHILMDQQGHIWLIDHGICFHTDFKLRTVIWDFVGEEIPSDLRQDLARLLDRLEGNEQGPPLAEPEDDEPEEGETWRSLQYNAPGLGIRPAAKQRGGLAMALRRHLTWEEIEALALRATRLLQAGRFPDPPRARRSYPWPPV